MHSFAENGYEVIAGEAEILFIDRKTWGLGWTMVTLGIVAILLTLLSGLSYVSDTRIVSDLAITALPAFAALLLIVIWLLSRTHRARRNQPVEEIQHTLMLNRSSQVLRDARGGIVVELADVKARMHIDWWTRGTMRLVVLSWPSGRRTIYRTFRRRRYLELLAFLNKQGLDAQ
jgi:hypothetical protein